MAMMTRRLDDDDDSILPPREPRLNAEREMTLGTGAILGIFFALVVLCGAFFGFGYKLGSGSAKAETTAAGESPDALPTASPSTNFNAFKPSAGSPAVDPNAGATTAPGIAVRSGSMPLQTPSPATVAPSRISPPASPAADSEAAAPHLAPMAPAASPAAMPATSATGTFVVQIAAVSHQEDAGYLVTALQAKGYAVAARTEPGDKLIHIQVGPFNNKTDADAMRHRLLADGYNAFIK